MSKTRVYPTCQNATSVIHPIDGRLVSGGADWTTDGFTARCLVDGAATVDITKAWKSPAAPVDLSLPPPHATQTVSDPPVITTRKGRA